MRYVIHGTQSFYRLEFKVRLSIGCYTGIENGYGEGLYLKSENLLICVIAGPGQWVDISEDGTVTVDGEALEEPYIKDRTIRNFRYIRTI